MSVRLELSDLPPRIRAQAEAQIAARGQKKAPAAPSMATAASIAETAGMEFDSRGEYNYYMGVILPKVQRGQIVNVETHRAFSLLPEKEYGNVKLPAARYTADFVLTYADGTTEVVEVKSKFTRRQQRDYIYRRRLFIDLVAEPRGWKFVEHITPDTSAEIKAWKKLPTQNRKTMKARRTAAVQRMMVRNSVSRCATSKISTKKNIMDNRKATDEVLRYCTIIAAFDVLEFDKDALDRLTAAMKNRADVYTTERAVLGQTRARQLLRERTEPMLDRSFVLPAGEYPRKQHEKDALAERRDAGDLTIRYFVEGLNEMGYDRAQINAAVEEVRRNYEQFLEWAVDGEYAAHTMLGRKAAEIMGGSVEVVAEPGAGQIFGKF